MHRQLGPYNETVSDLEKALRCKKKLLKLLCRLAKSPGPGFHLCPRRWRHKALMTPQGAGASRAPLSASCLRFLSASLHLSSLFFLPKNGTLQCPIQRERERKRDSAVAAVRTHARTHTHTHTHTLIKTRWRQCCAAMHQMLQISTTSRCFKK